jgi:hypothetical protein
MPGIKHIKIPEPIAVVNTMAEGEDRKAVTENGKPLVVNFRRFVLLALEHESFRTSREAFRSSEKLADLAETAQPGQVVAVAGDDLARLDKATENRSLFAWASWILRQLRPLFAALEDAKEKAEDFAPPPTAPAAPAAALEAPLPNGEALKAIAAQA